ncbi:MAG: hypothetical protein RL687_253 [Candidatus Parcubacteria bacterium]|jgi:guanylate kinase
METNIQQKEKLVIICAPSGAGKTTIAKHLLQRFENFAFSVSATTRSIRPSEKDGVDYYFMTIDQFKQKIANDEFAEFEENYDNGNFYGTLKSEIKRLHDLNKVILFDVDVRGARSLKKIFGEHSLVIFVKAPIYVLEERLRNRHTETEETIQKRLAAAPKELEFQDEADVVIENIVLDKAIIDAENAVFNFMDTSL